MKQRRFVTYIGFITGDDSRSADAASRQRRAAAAHLRRCGGLSVGEVVDFGMGGSAHDRPALCEAVDLCRREGATLLIVELDRLSRDGAFLISLRGLLHRSGTRLAAADMPEANEVTLGIMTAIAGARAAGIRDVEDVDRGRKRAFLVRLTDRHRPVEAARPADAAARKPACKPRTLERAAQIAPLLAEIRAAGATTFEQVAHALNELGIPSARGVRWYPSQVRRVEQRIASIA